MFQPDGSASLEEKVYTSLEEQIISQKLRPGESVTEMKLSRELGVSRTPVREALQRLDREGLIKLINELKKKDGIKETIKDYGIDEKAFLDNLDEMVEQAFDDQCTGANPRYPLMSEIKQMYLNAYYGNHFVEMQMPASKDV